MKKAVFFDFDLTLVDSLKGIYICSNKTLQEMSIGMIDKKIIKKSIGMPLESTFKFITGINDDEKAAFYKKTYIKNGESIITKNTKWLKHSVSCLRYLKSKNIKIGIISTKLRIRIEEFLIKEKIVDIFDIIIGLEDVKSVKPDPEGLSLALNSLKLKKEEVFYIGDTTIDQDTAFNGGVDFIAALTGDTKEDDFDKTKVNHFVKNLSKLKKVI